MNPSDTSMVVSSSMTTTAELAAFVTDTDFDDLSPDAVEATKRRVLDSLGIALGAVGSEATEAVRATVTELDADGPCRLWATDAGASPPEATMYNTALVRYLDYMDSFLAPGETPHPSDNIAAAVACADYVDASGRDLLTAIAIAYEVQGELAWNAPVRDKGWDHVTHTVLSAACAAAKVLDLTEEETRHALGIAGTAHNALRVTRTEGINMWKGLASANAARNGVYAAMLAKHGVEGPVNLFEGKKGWKQVISGDFTVSLDAGCPRLFDVMTKRYVAETYAQSAVEGIIELAEEHDLDPAEVTAIHLDTFAGAKLIIGGGEGSRYEVTTKAQADHSLPYMLAVALIDREMTNAAYDPARIRRDDVQTLLQRVTVEESERHTEQFENGLMPATLTVSLADGIEYVVQKSAFHGHPSKPMDWDHVEAKFRSLAGDVYGEARQDDLVAAVENLDRGMAADVVALLGAA